MNKDITTKQDVLNLADASNELCTAIEIFKLAHPDSDSLAWKNLCKQKELLWNLLPKFGY
ncbi:hypothetical protein AAKU64_000032 [Undibacterium sp. GrIS 1.8]|uniref:hypothetical protein n=1 Tax=unclassified Undibacterium TaxID=2630295 RepID=UPI0033935E4C